MHKPAQYLILFAAILWISILWTGCANPIPPSGGPKDAEPPKLIAEESTPNHLTSFDRREIVLTFDEWIQLKDPNLQIVISPPLAFRPDIGLKGKSIVIRFHENEVLRPQTTYLINFGSSIADNNEGNVLDQYKYVFSTGTFLDSLQIQGSIVSAERNEPVKQILIILHDNLSDTAFRKVLPAYFTKSSEHGQWKIENVRSDTFNVYALGDLNLNYRYDQPGEQIAFLGRMVILPDTSASTHRLVAFTEEPVIAVLDTDLRTAGETHVILSGTVPGIAIRPIESTVFTPFWRQDQDTIAIWNADADSVAVEILNGQEVIDTIVVGGFGGGMQETNRYSIPQKFLHPAQTLIVKGLVPIDTFSSERLHVLLGDTAEVPGIQVAIDTLDPTQIHIRAQWKERDNYSVRLDAGAITDIFQRSSDTLSARIVINPVNSYGQIFIALSGLNDSLQYLVQLVQPPATQISSRTVSGASETRISFERLQPQQYEIRIIEDLNRNGRWDTGNLRQRRQPERILIEKPETLRAGWDLEVSILWQAK